MESKPTKSRVENGRPPRHRTSREKGTELVEAALVVSLLLAFLIGIIWIARGFNTYQTLRRAAREGARFALAPSCAMCGNSYPTDALVRGVIGDALVASKLDPTQVTPDPIPILRDQLLNPGSADPVEGVVIQFSYPFDIYLPFTPVVLWAKVNCGGVQATFCLNVRVQMREEL